MKLEITIGANSVEIEDGEKLPLSIDYALEESADFQKKKGATALDITIPATLLNSKGANSFHNVSVADLTNGEVFRNPQPAVIKVAGTELLTGKAMLQSAAHTDRPEEYNYNFYGGNVDWMLELAETTLYDILKELNFIFTKEAVVASWQFNGQSESLPYVFAPVRYREPMDNEDSSMHPSYMKPSLSKYFVLFWALKKAGYRISSDFLNTEFFRRQVMPWTWGAFLAIDDSRTDNLRFLAKSTDRSYIDTDYTGFWDLLVTNDSTKGGYDNNGVYTYNAGLMAWKYLTAFNYGTVDATFKITIPIEATVAANGDNFLQIYWYRNNQNVGIEEVFNQSAGLVGRHDVSDIFNIFKTVQVNPGDIVSARVFIRNNPNEPVGRANIRASIDAFTLEYLRIPLGGTIDFGNYAGLKKYKVLDFVRGLVDEFNLCLAADTTRKIVLIEPGHSYKLPGETATRPGFFNGDFVEWGDKLDYSQKATVALFSDYERNAVFAYKEDTADGGYKIVKDRNTSAPGSATYVLPDRFKAGKKDFTNRFFAPLMHYDVAQWKTITGTAPQMPVMMPENVSNTSESAAQNTFFPKSAYYKGLINGLGWTFDGQNLSTFPLMFSVNYMPGGEADPVLSYTDEKAGNDTAGYAIAPGLLKTFFLQRLAIIRNGQFHTAFFKLNQKDAAQPWHREYKTYNGQRWELVNIQGYAPLKPGSTKCMLRKWVPVAVADNAAVYPSHESILNNRFPGTFDVKYSRLLNLFSDISKPQNE